MPSASAAPTLPFIRLDSRPGGAGSSCNPSLVPSGILASLRAASVASSSPPIASTSLIDRLRARPHPALGDLVDPRGSHMSPMRHELDEVLVGLAQDLVVELLLLGGREIAE